MYREEKQTEKKKQDFWREKTLHQKEVSDLYKRKRAEKQLPVLPNQMRDPRKLRPIDSLGSGGLSAGKLSPGRAGSQSALAQYSREEGAHNDVQDLVLLIKETKRNNARKQKTLTWIYDGPN